MDGGDVEGSSVARPIVYRNRIVSLVKIVVAVVVIVVVVETEVVVAGVEWRSSTHSRR